MLPLRDNQARRRLTAVNLILIAVNIAVFGYELSLGRALPNFIYGYALIPARLTSLVEDGYRFARIAGAPAIETLVTSMFLHGGILHVAGNMLYLFIFGAAVEESMGHLRFLLFYLTAGVVAGIAMVCFMPNSNVPVIGASGAIAGVLGAYFVLYPKAKILTVLPLFLFFYFIEIPAVIYLLIWFAAQLYWGVADTTASGGVAWWAHVGGFLFGVASGPLLAHRSPSPRRRRAAAGR